MPEFRDGNHELGISVLDLLWDLGDSIRRITGWSNGAESDDGKETDGGKWIELGATMRMTSFLWILRSSKEWASLETWSLSWWKVSVSSKSASMRARLFEKEEVLWKRKEVREREREREVGISGEVNRGSWGWVGLGLKDSATAVWGVGKTGKLSECVCFSGKSENEMNRVLIMVIR